MKTWKRSIALILVLIMAIGMMTACGKKEDPAAPGTPDAGEKAPETVQVVLGSGPIGGALYPIAGGIATIVNEYCDNVKMSVQVTAGGVENIRLVGSNELDLGIAGGERCYQANNGVAPYKDEVLDVEILGTLHSSVLQIVTLADSGIKEFEDLKGKKVAIGEAGGGAEQQFKQIVNALGWTDADITMTYMTYEQSMDQLGDGLLDAAVVYAGIPAAAITNLASRKAVQLVNLSEDVQKKWGASVDPFLSAFENCPAETYKGMANAVTVGVQRNMLACSANLDEEVAYQIAKAVYEHLDELAVFHASAKTIARDAAATAKGAELTEGAARWFKEAGILK